MVTKLTVFMFDLKVREHKQKMRKEAKQKAKSKSQRYAIFFAYLDFIILPCMHTRNLISQSSRKTLGSLTSIRLKCNY